MGGARGQATCHATYTKNCVQHQPFKHTPRTAAVYGSHATGNGQGEGRATCSVRGYALWAHTRAHSPGVGLCTAVQDRSAAGDASGSPGAGADANGQPTAPATNKVRGVGGSREGACHVPRNIHKSGGLRGQHQRCVATGTHPPFCMVAMQPAVAEGEGPCRRVGRGVRLVACSLPGRCQCSDV